MQYVRFTLRAADLDDAEPCRLVIEESNLPGQLFAFRTLLRTMGFRVTDAEDLVMSPMQESPYDLFAGTPFATGRESLQPSPTTTMIARDDVHRLLRASKRSEAATVVFEAVERRFPVAIWGGEIPRAHLWAFLFNQDHQIC